MLEPEQELLADGSRFFSPGAWSGSGAGDRRADLRNPSTRCGITNRSSGKMGLPSPAPPTRRVPRSRWWRVRWRCHTAGVRPWMCSLHRYAPAVNAGAQFVLLFYRDCGGGGLAPAQAADQKIKDGSGQTPVSRLWRTLTSWPPWRSRRAPRAAACSAWVCRREPRPAGACHRQTSLQRRAAAGGQHRPGHLRQDDNALLLVDAQRHRELPHANKLTLARQLVAEIAKRRADPNTPATP